MNRRNLLCMACSFHAEVELFKKEIHFPVACLSDVLEGLVWAIMVAPQGLFGVNTHCH